MEAGGLIGAIIIGIVAGWLAEKIMKRNHGLLTNLIVGLVGGVIGHFLASVFLGDVFGENSWIGSLILATIGAVILLFVLGIVKRGGRSA